MKFSTKSTYGLRALINLAKNKEKNVSLSVIAKEEHISQKYLDIIFAQLKKAKLVKSSKGVNGGYSLLKQADELSVYEIIKAVEKNMNVFHCLSDDGDEIFCNRKSNCGVGFVLVKVQQSINNTLKEIKLSELVK